MRMHNAPALICLAVCFLLLAGCSSSSPDQPISVAVSPQPAYVGSAQTVQITANVTGDTSGVTWSVSGSGGGTIDAQGNYTAPAVTQNATATVSATSMKDPTKSASTTVNIIAPSAVTTTNNAQVAQYSISVPDGLSVFIQFSTDTSYNLKTWSVAAPSGGGSVPILVAGMRGNTQYHMRAVFQQTGTTNNVFTDADHTFTTSAYPAAQIPSLTVTTAAGQTPQSGLELLDLVGFGGPGRTQLHAVVSDLSGNVLWAYNPGTSVPGGASANPIKLLPNGHFLINYSGNPDGQSSVVQEVDLASNVVWQMTSAQLNAKLAASTCAGCNITVVGTHHDFAILPNGHIVFIASTIKSITLPGGTTTDVRGDVLIDLDEHHNPVWIWNSFDGQLDVNRHPMSFPDWLHSNSVVYSPDDKALMLSMRHQAWVIKINYNDGSGDGHIMWKLGYQGDFALQSGTTNAVDPVDWFSAQHDANFISTTTAGMLDVLLFDNGNQRVLQASPLTLCTPATTPCDSRVPILHLDEAAKTADITWVDKLAPPFSFFGGSARPLQNGNVEFDVCATTPLPASNAAIFEVTKTTPPQTVWQMQIAGQFAYRGFRIPSLYPDVQW
jgi:arylsulfate sulfotransferase